jgi:hypothetical protein
MKAATNAEMSILNRPVRRGDSPERGNFSNKKGGAKSAPPKNDPTLDSYMYRAIAAASSGERARKDLRSYGVKVRNAVRSER